MANWQMNYGINPNAKGSDRMKCNVTSKGGDGLQLVMGGAIPDGVVGADQAIALAMSKAQGLDGMAADDPASHVEYLRTISAFCNELAAAIGGE